MSGSGGGPPPGRLHSSSGDNGVETSMEKGLVKGVADSKSAKSPKSSLFEILVDVNRISAEVFKERLGDCFVVGGERRENGSGGDLYEGWAIRVSADVLSRSPHGLGDLG